MTLSLKKESGRNDFDDAWSIVRSLGFIDLMVNADEISEQLSAYVLGYTNL